MSANYWPNLFTTQAQSSQMPRVGQHSQVWGGFGGVGVEIGFCHWTGLAPLLHLHLQLCSPPIGWPPTHIRNGQSNARNGEAELGAGGCRHPPRRIRGAATARGSAGCSATNTTVSSLIHMLQFSMYWQLRTARAAAARRSIGSSASNTIANSLVAQPCR